MPYQKMVIPTQQKSASRAQGRKRSMFFYIASFKIYMFKFGGVLTHMSGRKCATGTSSTLDTESFAQKMWK